MPLKFKIGELIKTDLHPNTYGFVMKISSINNNTEIWLTVILVTIFSKRKGPELRALYAPERLISKFNDNDIIPFEKRALLKRAQDYV
jgi:hypothetical protein